jgi:hypothetical protein
MRGVAHINIDNMKGICVFMKKIVWEIQKNNTEFLRGEVISNWEKGKRSRIVRGEASVWEDGDSSNMIAAVQA